MIVLVEYQNVIHGMNTYVAAKSKSLPDRCLEGPPPLKLVIGVFVKFCPFNPLSPNFLRSRSSASRRNRSSRWIGVSPEELEEVVVDEGAPKLDGGTFPSRSALIRSRYNSASGVWYLFSGSNLRSLCFLKNDRSLALPPTYVKGEKRLKGKTSNTQNTHIQYHT